MMKCPSWSFIIGVVTGITFVVWAQWLNSNGDYDGGYLILNSHPWLMNSKQLFCTNRNSLLMLFLCQIATMGISGLIAMKSDKEETTTSNTGSNTDSEFPEDIKPRDRQNKQVINKQTRARRTILPHQMP